jgi:hypothetical protein
LPQALLFSQERHSQMFENLFVVSITQFTQQQTYQQNKFINMGYGLLGNNTGPAENGLGKMHGP